MGKRARRFRSLFPGVGGVVGARPFFDAGWIPSTSQYGPSTDEIVGNIGWAAAANSFLPRNFFEALSTPAPSAPQGGSNVSLFTGQGAGGLGGGGYGMTDWGGLVGSLGQGVIGIFQAKQANKALKRLNRLAMGGRPQMMPSLAGLGGGLASGFAPATVPAAAAGGSILDSLGLGGLLGGLGGIASGLGPDILPGGLEESGTGVFGPDLFKPTASSARQRMIDAVHPGTGERVFWRPVGRPIMFAGDAALLKRTRKLARKMNAGCGAARPTFRRRRR